MQIEADYLVIGAGAMGMAFTDTILTETDASVAIVDRRGRPGGHWNDSYPFVRLHQPSAFYGVNSRELGDGTKDEVGWNRGLYELASGSEVVTYFDQIMNQQFLPSGRVHYLPMCEHRGDGRIESLLSDRHHEVTAAKIVDSTYMNVVVPSMRAPAYTVDPGVRCVALNELPKVATPPDGYTIVGGGKTAMDACLFLLANGVDEGAIRWIRPRDSWLLDRAAIQPGSDFAAPILQRSVSQVEQIAAADSIPDLFDRLEREGLLLRIDASVTPTMYRCATVTTAELAQLQRVGDVVRLGRVERITESEIVLDEGTIPTTLDTLHVDCTADGLAKRPVRPVFEGAHITLQSVRTCQQVFSAAFIGHVEAAYDDEGEKNELCTVVPHPDDDIDWLRTTLASTLNAARWREDAALTTWLNGARLDGFSGHRRDNGSGPALTALLPDLRRLQAGTPAAVERLVALLSEHDAHLE